MTSLHQGIHPGQGKGVYPLPKPLPFQTPGEERANGILHGLGVLLAVAGLVLLVLRAKGYLGGSGGGTMAVCSYSIFMAAMIAMFLTSTLYHTIQHEGVKRVFRIFDHSAIYLLIAGTYTPFCLLALNGPVGWICFGIEWALALTGITLHAVNCRILRKLERGVYIGMGWAVVFLGPRLVKAIPVSSLLLLMGGGLAYTLGVIWYSKPTRRGAHVIWHVFVLVGAVGHWWSVWLMS
ncbi:MAG: hemolysin III family protein [Treponema sp.]|nr:hemolysin III family protein [Treponema sp.]